MLGFESSVLGFESSVLGFESSVLGSESSVLGFESSVLGSESSGVGSRRTLCSLPSSPPPSLRRDLLLLLSRLPRWPLRRHGRGDAAATVVRWTRAFGRGVPERVRGPRKESGPGATTPTVAGETTRRTQREVATPFHFLWGLCK